MSYLPTVCGGCHRVALSSLADARSERLSCARCAGPLRILPGCSFKATDVAQFSEASQVVVEGQVTPFEALGLALEAERVLWSESRTRLTSFLDQLVVRLPGLVPIRAALGQNSRAQAHAVKMLRIILDAVASMRASGPPPQI